MALPGTSSDQAGSFVNPFNGKPLSTEQLQRELEVARYRSQLLEERLKQTSTEAEIKNVPIRKGVEAAQALTQTKKEELQLRDVEQSMKPQPKPSAQEQSGEPKPVKKSAKALAKEKAEAEAAARRAAEIQAAQAAAIPPATLLSVISVGGKNSVVLDIRGNVATIADGEMSPAGPVKVINTQSANVGGRTLKVHDQTIGRFVVSDAKKDPVLLGAGMPVGGASFNPGSNVTALPPSIPANKAATLPPPPLPAGLMNTTNANKTMPSVALQ
ncbi:hypothetical protein [Variovorax sp. SRS16]|uniref:hypothetical protein n=1 Tax=Variovorax sp. SRS16 TaxID=282217 RepID=UPI0013A52F42|nr:hypothetical protein [Variovorax sp. SRS16]